MLESHFYASGILLIISLNKHEWQLPLTFGGALFFFLHGLFHIQMLLAGMVICFEGYRNRDHRYHESGIIDGGIARTEISRT